MSKANLLVLIQFVMFGVQVVAFGLLPFSDGGVLRLIGVVLMIIGVVIVFASFFEHNRTNPEHLLRASPQPNEHNQLVETGLYRRIRHPIYTGVMAVTVGVGLIHGHVLVILIGLSFLPFFTYKATFEETLLQQTYTQYGDYMTRTGRFLPGL